MWTKIQVHHQQHHRKATPSYWINQKPTQSLPTSKLNPLLPTLHRLRNPQNTPKIRQTINKQKPCDGDIPPSKQIPPRHIHKRLPAHGEIRRVDVSKVRNGQTDEVVAENLGLGGWVADGHAEEEEEAVEVGELVGEGDAAGVDGGGGSTSSGRGVGGLVEDEPV